jgi:hypothetical protein
MTFYLLQVCVFFLKGKTNLAAPAVRGPARFAVLFILQRGILCFSLS